MLCELDKTDICNISNCIVSVKGMDSNSASPTDTWFLYFKNTFYNGEKVNEAFLKLFVDVDTYKPLPGRSYESVQKELSALKYELKIYKEVIRPLIDYNICPNFIKYLASGEKCSYDNLLKFLQGKIVVGKTVLTNKQVENILNKNISRCLLKRCDIRDSIQTVENRSTPRPDSSIKYDMILNENINKKTVKYLDWFRKGSKPASDLWETLFQVAAGCYAMSLSKTVHNDLHLGNIFIEDLGKKVPSLYIIDGKSYFLNSRYKMLIYDFDRGYTTRFGNNNVLDGFACGYGQCNEFVENKDIFKSLCYVINRFHTPIEKELIDCLGKTDAIKKLITDMYKASYSCFFEYATSRGLNLKNLLDGFNSTAEIIQNIGGNLPKVKNLKLNNNNIYVCDSRFFNSNGTINVSEYNKIYNEAISELDTVIKTNKSIRPRPIRPRPIRLRTPSRPRSIRLRSPSRPKSIRRKEAKPCNSNQVRNPKTGRCVLKTGPVGKQILAAGIKMSSIKKSLPRKKISRSPCKQVCSAKQICNPDTGRCVNKDGAIGKKVVAKYGY
jgi:hypothetical protein